MYTVGRDLVRVSPDVGRDHPHRFESMFTLEQELTQRRRDAEN